LKVGGMGEEVLMRYWRLLVCGKEGVDVKYLKRDVIGFV
jgi:hypothetical protein